MAYVRYNTGRSTQVKPSYGADKMATKIVVDCRSGSSDDDEIHPGIRYVTHVTQVSGDQFSYCMVGIPVETFGYEHAPTIALVKDSSVGRIRLRSRARCRYIDPNNKETVDLMCGWLVQFFHSIEEDSAVALVVDDRWAMTKVTIFGRVVYQPPTDTNPEGSTWYDTTDQCIFNRDGLPDCCDGPGGPTFAPARLYGHAASDSYVEPPPGGATLKSRSWRCVDIVNYLRRIHSRGYMPKSRTDYGNIRISKWIRWNSNICSPNQFPGFNRIPKHCVLENESVLSGLSIVARKAGPYDITMVPNGWYGELGFANMSGGNSYSGQRVYLPGYNTSSDTFTKLVNNPWAIKGGYVTESAMNYFDEVAILGDPPVMEKCLTMSATDTDYALGLFPAWTDADETAFKAAVTTGGDSEEAFNIACDLYPDVFCAYQVISLNGDSKIWNPTSNYAPPPAGVCVLLEHLLSGYSQDEANPRDWSPREIHVEWESDPDGDPPVWAAADKFDSLQVSWDGRKIRFDSLRRNSQQTWINEDGFLGSSFVKANLRMTIAVAHDHRISGRAGRNSNGSRDPNNTAYRIESNGEIFTWLSVAEPTDYVHWEREKSRPNGTLGDDALCVTPFTDQVGATPLFTDRASETSGRLPTHAKERLRDVKRIEYAGSLVLEKFNPSLKPGRTLILQGRGINPVGIIKAVTFDSASQQQTVELASFDRSEIYDIPSAPAAYGSGSAPRNVESTRPDGSYSDGGSSYAEDDMSKAEEQMLSDASDKQYQEMYGGGKKEAASSEGLSRPATGGTGKSSSSSSVEERDILDTVARQSESRSTAQSDAKNRGPRQVTEGDTEGLSRRAEKQLQGKYAPRGESSDMTRKFSADEATRQRFQDDQSVDKANSEPLTRAPRQQSQAEIDEEE